ncbi:hypothetical protein [Mesorhizobium sp. B2-8-5]|uniref:hypothetical protein n=1 Tax=Mesorhizobium sp. B2-8-5 TaxID=2589903 RepID=UPI00112CE5A3|nr:hypothetical protein [Mesorhizobium sp. B2-8-5]UCI28054.1 hypothetical protein FJ430_10825 [Mesorhizobium sp. B2-8-5]
MSGRGGHQHRRNGPHHLLVADDPIVPVFHFSERTNDLSNGLIWPKDGCASTAYAAMTHREFLPLGEAHSSRNQETRACAILRFAAVASDAAAVAFGLKIAIEAAWCGLGNENGD